MESFESSLRQTFLDEGEQLLDEAEQCFLQLEVEGQSTELVNKVFRLVHSLKGSAKAVGFLDLGELTHELENFLVRLKGGEIQVTPQVVSFLLEAVDTLKKMIAGLRIDAKACIDTSALRQRLVTFAPEGDSGANHGKAMEASGNGEAGNGIVEEDEGILFNVAELARFKRQVAAASFAPAGEEKREHAHDETIRVNLRRIDTLINNVGELVILQSVLTQHRSLIESRLLQSSITQLEKITHTIQDITMGLRMVPVKGVFLKLQRAVRDTAQSLGKTIEFRMFGEETELDRNMIEQINDPLVHLVRNAVDHGIEADAERLALGKAVLGCVTLKAFHSGNRIAIEVRDNGGGINCARVLEKAQKLGLAAANAQLSTKEIHELLFASGFSTKNEASEISGRGVGLDVVRTNVRTLNGDIEIESEPGQGTCFRLLLPLTLSIIEGMVVKAAGERYVLPSAVVSEVVQPEKNSIHTVSERGEFLDLRGESVPIFRLSKLLRRTGNGPPAHEGILVVVRDGRRPPYSVLVDDILAKQQVVIKSLGEELNGISGFSGGAILGDGKAALIVELGQIVPIS